MGDENNSDYVRVYTGPMVIVKMLQSHLQDAGINPIVKDDLESGLRGGFGGGLPDLVQLFIHKDEVEKAGPIVSEALEGI
ncbi:MAG: DUF2007 domain-containing protein [Flavobacteriaceae bacterium]